MRLKGDLCTQVRGRGPGTARAEEVRFRDITVGQLRDPVGETGRRGGGWAGRPGIPDLGVGAGRGTGSGPTNQVYRAPRWGLPSFPSQGHLAWVWDTSTSSSASQALAPASSSPVFQAVKARGLWHTGFQTASFLPTLAAVPAPSVCLPLLWDWDLTCWRGPLPGLQSHQLEALPSPPESWGG